MPRKKAPRPEIPLPELLRNPDLSDFFPGARRSTPAELATAEQELGIRLPDPLRMTLHQLGEIDCGSYRLLGTNPESSLSLVRLNRDLAERLPSGYVAIAARSHEGKLQLMGLWRSTARGEWGLAEWGEESSEGGFHRSHPLESFEAYLELHLKKKPRPSRRAPHPESLRPYFRTLSEWLRNALNRLLSSGTPADWHNGAAWDRYYSRQRRNGGWLYGRLNDPFIRLLEGYRSAGFLPPLAFPIRTDLPILLVGNGLSRDPLAIADLGRQAIAVDIARYPVTNLRHRDAHRRRKAAAGTAAERGSVLAVRANIFEYDPPGPAAAIVAGSFHYGFSREDQEELIRRFARWLAPGGLCYIHTGIEEGNRLKVDPTPWDQHGFLVLGAIATRTFMEARMNHMTETPDGRMFTPEGERIALQGEQDDQDAEIAHREAGGRFLLAMFGG